MRFVLTRARIVTESCVVRACSKKAAIAKAVAGKFSENGWEEDFSEIEGPYKEDVSREELCDD